MGKFKDFFESFKEGQQEFGKTISIIINSILLTVVYFFGVGLTSIFAKIFRKHFLDLKINENIKTYWTELNLTKKTREEYFRQF